MHDLLRNLVNEPTKSKLKRSTKQLVKMLNSVLDAREGLETAQQSQTEDQNEVLVEFPKVVDWLVRNHE